MRRVRGEGRRCHGARSGHVHAANGEAGTPRACGRRCTAARSETQRPGVAKPMLVLRRLIRTRTAGARRELTDTGWRVLTRGAVRHRAIALSAAYCLCGRERDGEFRSQLGARILSASHWLRGTKRSLV